MNIGLLGGRWVGQQHSAGFMAVPGVSLVAAADLSPELRHVLKATYGYGTVYEDYRDVLKHPGLDAVVIGLPTPMHYGVAGEALRRGLHVLCEKPPTTNAREMVSLERLARKVGRVFMFARQSRFVPRVLAARKMVLEGSVGDVYHADVAWVRRFWKGLTLGTWRMDRKHGGGVLLDLGVHGIDEAWFCMGCPRPVEVSAGLHRGFADVAPAGAPYTADDGAFGLVRFEGGSTLSFQFAFALQTAGPRGTSEENDRKANMEWRSVYLYGTKAGIDVGAGIVFRQREGMVSRRKIRAKGRTSEFVAQASEFVAAIRERREPLSSAAQAVSLMKILDAALRSGHEGHSVRIR